MSKFRDALERAKETRRELGQETRDKRPGRDAAGEDFKVRARAWLEHIAIASLQAAKTDVAGEITIDIDTAALDAESITPYLRFQIYITPKSGEKQPAPKTFTVAVQVDGGVSLSAAGIVAKDAGVISD